MTHGRAYRNMRQVFAESIDGITFGQWCHLVEIMLARYDELANMDSTEDMIRRITWDATANGLTEHNLKPRHVRLAMTTINATKRHLERIGG